MKRDLENRIRGWFPKEPYSIVVRHVKVDTEPKQPPLVIPPWSNQSATASAAMTAIMWIIISSMAILTISIDFDYASPLIQVAFLLAGLAVGAAYGVLSTKKIVAILSRKHQYNYTGKTLVLAIVLVVAIFGFFAVLPSIIGYSPISGALIRGFWLSFYSFAGSMLMARYVGFFAFEKRQNMRLLQSSMSIFVIPKAPDSGVSCSEVAYEGGTWKWLRMRIKELFIYQPYRQIGPTTIFIANFWKFTACFLFAPLFTAVLIFGTVVQGAVGEISIIGVYLGLVVFWLKTAHALQGKFKGLLFMGSTATTVVAGALLWLTIIDAVGFWTIALLAIPVFTLLYGWESLGQPRTRRILKALSVCFVIIGLISLVFSLALVYHVEDRLTAVSHHENIIRTDFTLNQSIPDVRVPKNLTVNDTIGIEVTVVHFLHVNGSSSLDVQISNQSLSSPSTPEVYFSATNRTTWISKQWVVPQNGTYYFTIHYNYTVETEFDVSIGRGWITNEMLPTKIATPYLAEFMAPTLLAASTLLATSIAIPIQQMTKNGSAPKRYKPPTQS